MTSTQILPEELVQLPITALQLSPRTLNCLNRAGFKTLGAVAATDPAKLMNIRNFGQKMLEEVQDVIQQLSVTVEGLSADELRELFKRDADRIAASLPEAALDVPLSMIGLSNRTRNALIHAGIKTVRSLLLLSELDLATVEGLGTAGIEDIEKTLAEYAVHFDVLLRQQNKPIRDNRRMLFEIDESLTPNLLTMIVPIGKALLQEFEYTREFDILKRRLGLERSKIYTLQEIGDFLDLTRERIRQLEHRAIHRIREALLGNIRGKTWRLPDVVISEARALETEIRQKGVAVIETEIVRLLEARYAVTIGQKDVANLQFLLTTLGFEYLSNTAFDVQTYPLWLTQPLDRSSINQVLRIAYKLLEKEGRPVSFFDLKIEINRKRKEKLENTVIRDALRLCSKIEPAAEDSYQLNFESLQSLADKALRILYEAGTQMATRDIARAINQRLAKAGIKAEAHLRSLQGQMGGDKRFRPIGRSGLWTLPEWDHISTASTIALMREFFHRHGTSATLDEIYAYVQEKRPDISRNSVGMYLSLQTDMFTRVALHSYELAEWGGTAYSGRTKSNSKEVREKIEAAVTIAFQGGSITSMPQRQLFEHVIRATGLVEPTVYGSLKRLPQLRFETDPNHPRTRTVYYVAEPTTAVLRKSPREQTQEAILAYLESQPERRALLRDVGTYVIKQKVCRDRPAFHYCISRMQEQVLKEQTPQGVRLALKSPTPNVPIETPLHFPQTAAIQDLNLRGQVERALKALTIDNVDLGLFQLGKIFEHEIKSFLEAARDRNAFPVNAHDLSKLVFMIECVDRNKITTKKHLLTLLREQRNERAHGEIPDFEERQRLMQHAPFLTDLYIEYIMFFHQKKQSL